MSVTIRCATPAVSATAFAFDSASAAVGAGDLREQPAAAGGQLRVARHHPGDPLVEPLAGDQVVLQQGGYGVGRIGHRRVAQHRQRPGRGVLDQPDGRVQHQPERALGADQEAVEPAPSLRQQVLEGVARHLAPEAAELGADGAEVLVDQGVESVVARRCSPPTRRPAARSAPRRCRRCGRSPGPASRRRCCRPSRRSCSGCASTGRARTADRAAPPAAAVPRARHRAAPVRCAAHGSARGPG